MKPLRTIFTIVSLVMVHSGIEASADQYRRSAPGASSAARAEYTAPGSFHNFVGDEPMGLPTSYQPEAVLDHACTASACASGCSDSATCGSKPCRSGLLWDPWVDVDYMFAWRKGRDLPPLITTSPSGTDPVLNGTPVFGGTEIGDRLKAGGYVKFGAWLDEDRHLGLGGKFLMLERDSTIFSRESGPDGVPQYARPYYNSNPLRIGGPGLDAQVISSNFPAFAPTITGNVQAKTANDLLGTDAYIQYLLYACNGRRLDLIAGYKFNRIGDSLGIHQTSFQQLAPGSQRTFDFQDVFGTENDFHGAELGLLGEYDSGPITFSLLGQLGMGNMHEVVTITGQQSTWDTGQVPVPIYQGGLLALPTNIGTYTRDEFALVPEMEFKLIYHLTRRLDFSLGYSMIYWNKVALAADQIETNAAGIPVVNSSQIPKRGGVPVPPPNPALNEIRQSDFWVQGINFGLTLKL